ncbi:hypothetical protein [Halorubrum saccharovorum]|uniref:hypothetical protein n=1 Tax=Halorubrum saccharovorum TaxID=2248 RepID=UPI0019552345|nr:hypothetical protein [Halorubrum saccharovorum]
MNPATIVESPSNENSMEIVDHSAGRSIAIFSVVLVVIQSTLGGDTPTYYETIALTTLTIAAGFLIITFVLELFADLKILLFRIQLTSLRYSGLLLFLGLFLLLKSKSIPSILPNTFGAFVGIAWLIWIIHEAHYILKTQRKDWNIRNISRTDWLRSYIGNLINRALIAIPTDSE